MLANLFTLCAMVGGTVLTVQFVMTFLGFLEIDLGVGDDVPDGDLSSDSGDHAGPSHGEWLWGMISFRNLVAAATFFGLIGLAMRSAAAPPAAQLLVASLAGFGAMYGVHQLMRGVARLARDNTIQIKHAIGQTGTVYLTIPGDNAGTGKIHITVDHRLEEFDAVTPWHDKLSPGAKVVVTGIVGADTLEVQPLPLEAKPTPSPAETALNN